ncbi:Ig-like domain-containing protein [Niallia circulans]|uniref:Ig-like domain-containing protein n=1 Tax=Niallia circulans TaxID=1397 RepID=UPI00155FEF58|nr:Ig-like domain-containing protein [Niallia circulans]NRG32894.1 Ig-like domain-containing protein [Niallia circulans]
MKKKLFLLIATITVIISSLSFYQFNSNKVEAATIGQQLKSPEAGWKRYDDQNEFISYGANTKIYSASTFYKGTIHQTHDPIIFKFEGTKFRIIALHNQYGKSKKIDIYIDGEKVDTISQYNTETTAAKTNQLLSYEKLNLSLGEHTVELRPTDGQAVDVDAIDIDEDGKLLEYGKITLLKLSEDTLEMNVGSSKSLVVTIEPENATNKTIKWTSTNPEIATVDDNGNVIGKSPGKVTITAETTDGSNLKATAEVTVKEAEVEGNKGILKLTTTTGDLHEYDLSRTEINNFIAWLDKKGEGKPYYEFKLNVTTGNIKSRTEYIMFDEIVSFVIDEY